MLELLKTEEELKRFMKLNTTSLKLLGKHLRAFAESLGEKNKYENQITKLKGIQTKAKQRLRQQQTVVGAGLGPKKKKRNNIRSERVQWVELKSAFRSRIRTGAVINLSHRLPDPFLSDAMVLIKRRLETSLKKNQNIKVNFELSCKYELQRTMEVEDKFFQSANVSLTPTSDLDEILHECSQALKTKVSLANYYF